MLYSRKDLLEKSGYSATPKTREELKAKRDSDATCGFVFLGVEYEGGVCDGCEHIWTQGGNILHPQDPSKVVIDSPESASRLQTYHSMIADGVARRLGSSTKRISRMAPSSGVLRTLCATGPTCTRS
jgi:multiple sugar transport system substrate-binding protein